MEEENALGGKFRQQYIFVLHKVCSLPPGDTSDGMECSHVEESATLSREVIGKVQPHNWACAGGF